jgi:hypothetical protein
MTVKPLARGYVCYRWVEGGLLHTLHCFGYVIKRRLFSQNINEVLYFHRVCLQLSACTHGPNLVARRVMHGSSIMDVAPRAQHATGARVCMCATLYILIVSLICNYCI